MCYVITYLPACPATHPPRWRWQHKRELGGDKCFVAFDDKA